MRKHSMQRKVLVTTMALGMVLGSLNTAWADVFNPVGIMSTYAALDITNFVANFKPFELPVTVGMDKKDLNNLEGLDAVMSLDYGPSFFSSFNTVAGDVISYSGCNTYKDIYSEGEGVITGIQAEFLASSVSLEEVFSLMGSAQASCIDMEVADGHLYRWDNGEYSIMVSVNTDNIVKYIGVCNAKAVKENITVYYNQMAEALGAFGMDSEEVYSLVDGSVREVIGNALGDEYTLLDAPVVVENEANTDLINDLNGTIYIKTGGNTYGITLGLADSQLEEIQTENFVLTKSTVFDDVEYLYSNYTNADNFSVKLNATVSAARVNQLIQERKAALNMESVDADTEIAWAEEFYAALGNMNIVYSVGAEYDSVGDLELEAIPRGTNIATLKAMLGEPYVNGSDNIWRVRDVFLNVRCGLDGSVVAVQVYR